LRKKGEYRRPSYVDPDDVRLVSLIRQGAKAASGAVNLLGIPFDGATLGRKGSAGGPAAIRSAMSGFSNYNIEEGVGLEGSRVVDLGDIEDLSEDVIAAHRKIEAEVSKELKRDSLLVLLGGDNSVSLPSLRATAKKFGRLGLVVIDSHLDLRGKINGKPTSGSSYGLAIEELEGLDPRRVVEIGAHGFLHSETYVKKARRLGVNLVTAEEVSRIGAKEVGEKAYSIASDGAEAVYLSIDVDAVDLGEVSGVSAPTAGGMSAREMLDVVMAVGRGKKTVSADIVELAPSLDPSGKSSIVGGSALAALIGAFVSRTHS